jgi:hypothetical protein
MYKKMNVPLPSTERGGMNNLVRYIEQESCDSIVGEE